MNIETVARRANVSIATVSRVINQRTGVSTETAKRVQAVLEEIGYVPNRTAKALVSGRSHILGMIVSDITNPFFPEIIKGFEDIAIQHRYEIITVSSNYDARRMEQCVHRLLERSVDGVAVMTSEFDPMIVEQLTRLHVPTVFLDVGTVSDRVSNIRVDYESGVREAVNHLIGLNHRRIGFISGPSALTSARIRRDAFLRALHDAGLGDQKELLAEGNHKIDGGFTAMERLLPHRLTAVLASNDLTAFGALRAVRRAGLSVPADISVIGFDDIQLSEFTDPPLTTVRLGRADIAVAAFTALVNNGGGNDAFGCEIPVKTSLVVRGSSGPSPNC